MTTQPKTLSLGPREWNALLACNATDLATFFQGQPTPTVEAYQQIIQHMERMKEILPGWLASAPAAAPNAGNQQGHPDVAAVARANGAVPQGRKKGGWPLGKKRTRKAPAAQVQ